MIRNFRFFYVVVTIYYWWWVLYIGDDIDIAEAPEYNESVKLGCWTPLRNGKVVTSSSILPPMSRFIKTGVTFRVNGTLDKYILRFRQINLAICTHKLCSFSIQGSKHRLGLIYISYRTRNYFWPNKFHFG